MNSNSEILKTDLPKDNASPLKLANIFRQIGVVAVALSAVIYMLQGVENVSLELRHWTWLVLMIAMGCGGYISRTIFDDVKGARIFFTLAAALIPVQFSQLGGMIFDMYQSGASTLDNFWKVPSLEPIWLGVDVFASLALAVFISVMAFSILVRKQTKETVLIFLAMNLLMLLPVRSSIGSIVVLALMIMGVVVTHQRIFGRHLEFKTPQGKWLRALVCMPVMIVLVRNCFHVDSISAFSMMGGLFSAFLIYGVSRWVENTFVREICLLMGGLCAAFSWLVFSVDIDVIAKTIFVGLPLLLLCFEMSRQSEAGVVLYRNVGCVISSVMCMIVCVAEPDVNAAILVLLVGVGFVVMGVVRNLKFPLVFGVMEILVSLASISFLSFANLSVNIWLTLAVVGGLLVLFSSVIEKYGRFGFEYLQKVKEFE